MISVISVKSKIEIDHGFYDSDFGVFVYRQFDKKNNMIIDEQKQMELPLEIKTYIRHLNLKWAKKGMWNRIREFSVAHDPEDNIWAVTVVHPKDHFVRKVGAEIVRDRVERQRGDLAFKGKDEKVHRFPYNTDDKNIPAGVFYLE